VPSKNKAEEKHDKIKYFTDASTAKTELKNIATKIKKQKACTSKARNVKSKSLEEIIKNIE